MEHIVVLLLIKGLILGSIYALISLGFNVIYRTTGVINFAQGEFVMVGAWSPGGPIPRSHGRCRWPSCRGCSPRRWSGCCSNCWRFGRARGDAGDSDYYHHRRLHRHSFLRALMWGTEPYYLPLLQGRKA